MRFCQKHDHAGKKCPGCVAQKMQAARDAACARFKSELPEDGALPRPYFRSTGLRERKFWRLTSGVKIASTNEA